MYATTPWIAWSTDIWQNIDIQAQKKQKQKNPETDPRKHYKKVLSQLGSSQQTSKSAGSEQFYL